MEFITGILLIGQVLLPSALVEANFRRTIRETDNVFTCTLPPYPDHGSWSVVNGHDTHRPGSTIEINSIIKFKCDTGYKLISKSSYVICNGEYDVKKVPECGKLCPPMYSTTTTILKCVDRTNREILCSEATDGAYMSYSCLPYYEPPIGYKKNLLCLDGTWSFPKPVCQPICGRKRNDDSVPLVYGGIVTKEVVYPWISAVYRRENEGYVNICGGSLISRRIVLTAAHCVTNDYGEVLPRDRFQVGIGKVYRTYNDSRDPKAQYLEVADIIAHKEFKGARRNYLADIALIVTKKLVILSESVLPVCVSDVNSIYLHAGDFGEIAGWGMQENGVYSDELRYLIIPYKYETSCAHELDRDWADKYNLVDKLCAGFYKRNISICKGDSGSGLTFKNPEDNRYYVHGVASLAPGKSGQCNTQENSLYTKVAHYYIFVDRELAKHYVEDCKLPAHPQNGRWLIDNVTDKKPGDIVPSTTVLKIACDNGYKLAGKNDLLECEESYDMPLCNKMCPPLDFPPGTTMTCKDNSNRLISCQEIIEGGSITYNCPKGYSIYPGATNNRYCLKGSWDSSFAPCQKYQTDPPTTLSTTAATPVSTLAPPIDNTVPPALIERTASTKVICTYASWWAHHGVFPEDFDPSLCTHIVYSFAGIWSYGDVRIQEDALDLDNGANKGLFRRVTELKKKNKDLKVLLSIGGTAASNSSIFSSVAGNIGKIKPFTGSAGYFLKTYNFDGLNIEWHYPEESDKDNFINFLQEVKNSLKPQGFLFSVSVRSYPDDAGYDAPRMNQLVDFVIVKTYDMYGSWSAYTGQHSALYSSSTEYLWEKTHLNIDAAAKNWMKAGIDKHKMVLSIAFYGRTFTLKDKNQHGVHAPISGAGPGVDDGFLRWSEICEKYENYTHVWDDEQKGLYTYNDKVWIGHENKDSVWIKASYVKENNFFGVNVWPLDGDDVHGKCGRKQQLLKHVNGGLGNSIRWD